MIQSGIFVKSIVKLLTIIFIVGTFGNISFISLCCICRYVKDLITSDAAECMICRLSNDGEKLLSSYLLLQNPPVVFRIKLIVLINYPVLANVFFLFDASRIVNEYGPKLVEPVVILENHWFFMIHSQQPPGR